MRLIYFSFLLLFIMVDYYVCVGCSYTYLSEHWIFRFPDSPCTKTCFSRMQFVLVKTATLATKSGVVVIVSHFKQKDDLPVCMRAHNLSPPPPQH